MMPADPSPDLPSLELRAAVAVEIFGYHKDERSGLYGKDAVYRRFDTLPHWEFNRTAADLVLREIERRRLLGVLADYLYGASDFDPEIEVSTIDRGVEIGLMASPAEICRSALMAVREIARREARKSTGE